MSDAIKDKWQAIIVALVLGWQGWLSLMVIRMDAKLEVQTYTKDNVIPPVVEASMRELREKGNKAAELINLLSIKAEANGIRIQHLEGNSH